MNRSKIALLMVMMISGLVVLAQSSFAARLLSDDEALNEVLGKADSTQVKEITLEKADKDKVKAKLGDKSIMVKNKYKVILATNGKQSAGAAIIVKQPGKWGDIEFMVGLDSNTAKVKKVAVMASEEKRGRPITQAKFLNQFIGKSSADNVTIDKDIDGISGATISAKAAAHAVRAAIAVYETMVLKK